MSPQPQAAEEVSSRARLWLAVGLIIAAVIILAAFMSMKRGDVAIHAARADRQTITSTISTNGKIEPVKNFEAHAPAPITVKRVLVSEGDQVKRGQLLVQLDDAQVRSDAARALAQVRAAQADLQAVKSGGTHEEVLTTQSQLEAAQTELESASRNLNTLRQLQKTGAASPAEVQQAELRVQSAQNRLNLLKQKQSGRYAPAEVERAQSVLQQAQAAYAAAQDMLGKTDIRSPQEGSVYSLPVRPGNFVNSGELIVAVADLSKVQVRAFVDEPDIGRLAVSQQVAVSWDALPGRFWEGRVTQVPTTVTTRGARTVGELVSIVDNQDRKLLPNINVSVLITAARHDNVLTIPREAVHQQDGQRFVYQVVGGQLRRRDVETSISNLTRIEVTKGVPEGGLVALSSTNNQPLRDGLRVRALQ